MLKKLFKSNKILSRNVIKNYTKCIKLRYLVILMSTNDPEAQQFWSKKQKTIYSGERNY